MMVSNKQLAEETVRAIKRISKRASHSKQSARALLRAAGVVTKSGKLTKPYR